MPASREPREPQCRNVIFSRPKLKTQELTYHSRAALGNFKILFEEFTNLGIMEGRARQDAAVKQIANQIYGIKLQYRDYLSRTTSPSLATTK